MSEMSQAEVVRVLVNLDTMACSAGTPQRRAWAHIFIACGLIAKVTPSDQLLTRERFMELCGRVYDKIYGSLRSTTTGGQA